MHDNLRNYIDELFISAPKTKKTVEVKEEILQNLFDKYDDLLSEGKSEEAAYNIAIASIGDISELIDSLKEKPFLDNEVKEQQKRSQSRSALLISIAVALYIFSVIPVILIDSEGSIAVMFAMVAIATALLVYNHMTKVSYPKNEDTIVEDFKEWRENSNNKSQVFKSISSALWALIVVVYFLISFGTHAWHITWVVFLIGAAINSILKAIFDLSK